MPVAPLAGPMSDGAAGGSFGGGGGVNGEPPTHRGPPLAVPEGPPATELATVEPEPSLRPQRAISPLPDESSCDIADAICAGVRAKLHTRASSMTPLKKPAGAPAVSMAVAS